MQKMVSIGLIIGALTATALPVHADDQSIYRATDSIGRGALSDYPIEEQPQYYRAHQFALGRAASWLPLSTEAYGGYAQSGGYDQGGGYGQKSCSYVGGPKNGVGWSC
jgi:hypothetical protein